MIEQNVQVVRCEGDRIWLRMGSQAGCTACENGNGCGAGIFAKLLQTKPVTIVLERKNISVRPGQMVTLAFPEQIYLKMVLAYYGWPLVVALGGAFAGYGLATRFGLEGLSLDIMTLAGGLLSAAWLIRLLKKRNTAEAMLGAMRMAVYYPSATPGMCGSGTKEALKN